MISGTFCASSPSVERQTFCASGSRPTVVATMPAGRNVSAAVTAWRSNPPRLSRKSSTIPPTGCGSDSASCTESARCEAVLLLKLLIRSTSTSAKRCENTVSGGTIARISCASRVCPSRPRQDSVITDPSGPDSSAAIVAGS